MLAEIEATGAELVGVSVDGSWAHKAFREQLGLDDAAARRLQPKGEVARAYGAYLEEWGTPTARWS